MRVIEPAFDPAAPVTLYGDARLAWDGAAWWLPETRLALAGNLWSFELALGGAASARGALATLQLSGDVTRAGGSVERRAAAAVSVWPDAHCQAGEASGARVADSSGGASRREGSDASSALGAVAGDEGADAGAEEEVRRDMFVREARCKRPGLQCSQSGAELHSVSVLGVLCVVAMLMLLT